MAAYGAISAAASAYQLWREIFSGGVMGVTSVFNQNNKPKRIGAARWPSRWPMKKRQ